MNSVAVAEGCGLAATGCEDSTVKVWRLRDGTLHRTLHGHEKEVWRVVVDCNERWIASGSGDNTVWLWDLGSGEPLDQFTHDDCVAALAFSPDGRRLIVGCDNTKIYVYGLENATYFAS
jgi:WD40 repeat protein